MSHRILAAVMEAPHQPVVVRDFATPELPRGGYVVAGHYTDVGLSTVNAHHHINRKHLEIRGCWGSEVGHFLRALSLLERHAARVPWHAIGGRRYGLHALNQALEDAAAMRITKALVDPWDLSTAPR